MNEWTCTAVEKYIPKGEHVILLRSIFRRKTNEPGYPGMNEHANATAKYDAIEREKKND